MKARPYDLGKNPGVGYVAGMATDGSPSPSLLFLARRAARRQGMGGFSLIELMTVAAIVAVLGTLLLSAVHAAQRKSRLAACMGNLHQLSLALNMYLDDSPRRPQRLSDLVNTKYLPGAQCLRCPEDHTVIQPAAVLPATDRAPAAAASPQLELDSAASYAHPLRWEPAAWNRLLKAGSLAGVAACQWHGLGRANTPYRTVYDREGLVLRAQRDGAVVQRHVFWRSAGLASFASLGESSGGEAVAEELPTISEPPGSWPLFADEFSAGL